MRPRDSKRKFVRQLRTEFYIPSLQWFAPVIVSEEIASGRAPLHIWSMGLLPRFVSLFSWRRLPGLLLGLLGIVWRLADYFGRLDVLVRVAEGLGGTPPMLVSAILSPWFSVALVLGGAAYIVFIGEPQRGVQRHPWWPYIGWITFGLCLTTMIVFLVAGATEFYIRREIAKGIAGIPRETPSNITSPGNQRPLVGAPRALTPDQQRLIYLQAARMKDELPALIIAYTQSDNESLQYANQLQRILIRAGIQVDLAVQFPRGPEEDGVMIAVQDPSSPNKTAQRLRTILEVAEIQTKFIRTAPAFGPNPIMLFIGPLPLLLR